MKTTLCTAMCAFGAITLSINTPAFATEPESRMEAEFELLNVGDDAPELAISDWLKGDAVDGFEPGHVYVVEFWATWCGPCIASMPHVSELQREYEDEVTVIGVSVDRDKAAPPKFMKDRGDQPSGDELMDYTVAMQDGRAMSETWMAPAMERGIPCAFIVNQDQQIAWIGHPARMDDALEQIVNEEWDIDEARLERFDEKTGEMRAQREMERFNERTDNAAQKMWNARDAQERMEAVRTILENDPPADIAGQATMTGFSTLGGDMGDIDAARAFLDTHRDHVWDNAYMLNAMSWGVLTYDEFEGHRDADLALKIAERADALTNGRDASILDTLARAHFLRAIEVQQEAVEKAPASMKGDLEEILETYKKAYAEQI